MASEIRNDSSSTEAYRQKLAELRDEQEQDIEKTRERNHKTLEQEKSSGEATINHIRKDVKERIASTREQGDNRVDTEKNSYDKRLRDLQKQKETEVDGLKRNLRNTEEELQHQTGHTIETQHEAQAREQNISREVTKKEEERRNEMIRKNREEISQAQGITQAQKNLLQSNQNAELEKIKKTYEKAIETLKSEQNGNLTKLREQDKSQIANEENKSALTLEKDRKETMMKEEAIRNQGRTVLAKENADAQTKLLELKKEAKTDFDRQRIKSIEANEKIRNFYAKEYNRVETQGNQELAAQKELNQQNLAEQKVAFEEEKQTRTDKFEEDKKKAFEVYKNQMATSSGAYKQTLDKQKTSFDEQFARNAEANKEVIENSKTRLAGELVKEKAKAMHSLGKYNDKMEDPFYQINTIDYQLSDDDSHYELSAKIPEKDKDNIKAVVENNRIVLHGQRRFEDKIENPDNKVETASYQTFRQEIPLKHPVAEKFAKGEWADGVFKLRVPKA
jgi:HSP20 family molecular chaperone IbpA